MIRFAKFSLIFLLIAIITSVSACSGGGSGGIPSNPTTPTVSVKAASSSITTAQSLSVTIAVSGSNGTPTGSVVLSGGGYTSSAITLSSSSATTAIAAGSLAVGSDTLTAKYTPDSASTATYGSAFGTGTVTVTTAPKAATVTVTPEETTHPYAENLIVTATVKDGSVSPGGSVILSSGTFASAAVKLNNGSATFYVQPGSLAQGSDTLAVTYTPDSSSSSTYGTSTGTVGMTISAPGSTNITVNINTLANRHLISPYIYGINSSIQTDINNLSPTLVRQGGNAASDFNWTNSHYNAAGDYFFEDYGFSDGYGKPLDTVGFTRFTMNSGSHQLNTMPMLSWSEYTRKCKE